MTLLVALKDLNTTSMKKNFKKYKKETPKLNASNSKILHDTMVTLGALKENHRLYDLPMHEIQVHLLDKDGDGIVLCLEYDERNGEIEKTFHSVDDAAYDEYGEEYHEEEEAEPLDPYAKVPNVAQKRFEETVSEEYDEIFHNSDDSVRKRTLLN